MPQRRDAVGRRLVGFEEFAVPEFWSTTCSYPWNLVAAGVTAAALLFGFVGVSAFLAIWAERKVSGRIQDRLGPTRVGPFGCCSPSPTASSSSRRKTSPPTGADHFLFRSPRTSRSAPASVGFLALPFGNGSGRQEPERRGVLHARGAVERSLRHHAGRATPRRASGRSSAACARRPRWSATKCRGPCAWWCRSAWPGR